MVCAGSLGQSRLMGLEFSSGGKQWKGSLEEKVERTLGLYSVRSPQPTKATGQGDRLSCASSRENCGKCHDLNLLWDLGGAACKWGQIRQRQPNC